MRLPGCRFISVRRSGPASRYAFAIPLKACPRIRFGQIGCREPTRFSPRSGRARVDCACGLVHTLETPAMGLVSRALPVHTAMRNCTGDEGGPFEFGNQVLI